MKFLIWINIKNEKTFLFKILNSIINAKSVTITKSDKKIDNVVITPNRINGVKEPNVKLKNPIAVVNEVKKTGLPISKS